jgi:hypothetical protein
MNAANASNSNDPATNAPPTKLAKAKAWLDAIQASVTILGIIVGGIWTYMLFIKDRQDHAHATVEEKISHIPLTPDTNYVQVVLTITNAGHTLIRLSKGEILLQRITPIHGCSEKRCVIDDINDALQTRERTSDQFPWPVVASRMATWAGSRLIEPGESEIVDFEFVIPSEVSAARVYAWIKNDEMSTKAGDMGWHAAAAHSFNVESKK